MARRPQGAAAEPLPTAISAAGPRAEADTNFTGVSPVLAFDGDRQWRDSALSPERRCTLKALFILVLCAISGAAVLQAEEIVTSRGVTGGKLVTLIPNLYGPNGLTLPNPDHEAHFDSAFQSNFAPFNSALATQLTTLPVPSPSSGFTYSFDPNLGVYTRSTNSFGPILTERAETIGKDKFFAGVTVQRFNFESLDNIQLDGVPAVFEHVQTTPDPNLKKDIITTGNFLSLQLSQTVGFFTYGLTDRIDISVAIPQVNVSLNVSSNAIIQRIGTATQADVHYFRDGNGNLTDRQKFSSSGSASGLGDVTVRVKGTAIRSKAAWLALGVDVRMPTGDAYDFLGSGAYGARPFAAISFRTRRITPHVNVGYQWNGESVLAGDIGRGTKANLPNHLNYAVGVDAGVNKKLSLAVDLLGDQIYNTSRLKMATFTAADGQKFPEVQFYKGTANLSNMAFGIKVNPVRTLLVSFNLLVPVNHAGLRARVVPLIGLSYAF